ncbi:unnamed protein product [Rhodiola kirilowii]
MVQDPTRLDGFESSLLDFVWFNFTNRLASYVQPEAPALKCSLVDVGWNPGLKFALVSMENIALKPGTLVFLSELHPDSQYFKQGASLRVTAKLQEYHVETAIATIVDGGSTFKIDTQHLRDLTFRNGSIYQFIGELNIQPDHEGILNARVGRNVDGLDLNLYHQSIKLLRQFQTGHMNNKAA